MSESSAYMEMVKINSRGDPHLRPLRSIYLCDGRDGREPCWGYHLTSKEPGRYMGDEGRTNDE